MNQTDLGSGQPARRPRRDRERGAVLMLTALVMPVLLLMTAFAVDLGQQRAARRNMQAKADVIALDLARLLDGSTAANNINYSAALTASELRNNLAASKVTAVQWGTLDQTTKAFVQCTLCIPTSVKVITHDTVSYVFQRGNGAVTRSAVGTLSAKAGFEIGSFAAAVNSGSGPLLNALIGNSLGLGALGYSGLASDNITFLGIANQMGLGTPSSLFTSNVTAFQALTAAAQILQAQNPNAAELQVLNTVLAVPNSPLKNVTIGQLANVSAGSETSALASNVNLFDLLTAAAFVANGSGLAIPTATLNLPGSTFSGTLNLIQAPQWAYGGIGASAKTSQAGLTGTFSATPTSAVCTSQANIISSLLSLVPNIVNLLLGGSSCGLLQDFITVTVQASVNINLASAVGTINSIGCGTPQQLGIGVNSGLISAGITFTAVVKSGNLVLANVPLGLTNSGGPGNGAANFTLPPDQFGVFKSSTPANGSLGLNSTNITGLGGLGSLLTPAVNTVLGNATTAVNNNLLLPITNALGVRVAGADVAPLEVACNAVSLAG